ncbi:MAG: PDZ domain-containing protein, partial [Oscillospiraceae bacterium]|nr:PDZ domain-containing protein [Oscillospiraceae bacterium]
MRGPIKRAAAFLTVCGMVYLSFIGYGMRALPGELPVTGQQTVALGAPYTARVPEQPAEPVYQFLQVFPVKTARITTAKRAFVLVGGDVFGIKLYTRGVLVAKTDMVTTQNGNENPAQAAGLRSGDVITEINGREVNRKSEVSRAI